MSDGYPQQPDVEQARKHAEVLAYFEVNGYPEGNRIARIEMLLESLGAEKADYKQAAIQADYE